jgi:RHS repeat-associated protein
MLPTGAAATYNYGNELTTSTLAGATTNYAYNADGEQLTSAQGSTTESSATWSGAGQLTSYENISANMTNATYNAVGERASITVGATTQQFVGNTALSAPQFLMDSANAYIFSNGNTPAEQVNLSTGAATYLVPDALGSVRGAVSSSGALARQASYDAWGNPLTTGGLTALTPFGFAGAYTDASGLLYLINRYYEPQVGQFLSVDPDLAETDDAYAYADGNPISSSDPDGDSASPPPAGGEGYAPDSPYYVPATLAWRHDFDGKSVTVPLRQGGGTHNWGIDKICNVHALCSINATKAVGKAITRSRPKKVRYDGPGERYRSEIAVYDKRLWETNGELFASSIRVISEISP